MDFIKSLAQPVSDLFTKAFGLVDNLTLSGEEKLKAQQELLKIQQEFQLEQQRLSQAFVVSQADVIKSEVNSGSWLAKNWRPILMLTFVFIIAWNFILVPVLSTYTKLPPSEIPPDMWDLLKIGIGGYVGGRTLEKVAPTVAKALKK